MNRETINSGDTILSISIVVNARAVLLDFEIFYMVI